MVKRWAFSFDGIAGRVERTHSAVFVFWGGMGFHLNCADDNLRNAILAAEPA